ncbi:MAG TPA: biotin/lipoyl-binding protein [Steroidobacteraceae bacterium]
MDSPSEHTGRTRRPDSPSAADGPAGRPWFRRRGVLIAAAVVVGVVVVLGVLWYWYESGFATTSDAYIDTHIAFVSPQVAGQVRRVPVQDNQLVKPGQALAEIDPARYQLALQQALASQEQAQTGLGQANASVAVAQAGLAQASADLASARATATRAQRDLERYQKLRQLNPRAVARNVVDEAVATARSAAAQQRAAQQRPRRRDSR